MTVRAKMRLNRISQDYYNQTARELVFNAVSDDGTPENQRFAFYTPSGNFTMLCNNPAVLSQLELGKEYYFDITPAGE